MHTLFRKTANFVIICPALDESGVLRVSKVKPDSSTKPAAARDPGGQLPPQVASFVAVKLPGAKPESTPTDHLADFEAVAILVAPDPPAWLAKHLMGWSASVLLSRAVEKRQPTRAEMRKILTTVNHAAGALQRALRETAIREILDAGGDAAMQLPGNLTALLGDIEKRAKRAATLPVFVNREGKTKAGRGRALPDGAILSQTYCALLIAETWKWFRGEYPRPRNRDAAKAADLFWRLSGGEVQSWGNDKLATWRSQLKKIPALKADKEIAEYRRHLREWEHQATLLTTSGGQ
jgi:hypothetical protein